MSQAPTLPPLDADALIARIKAEAGEQPEPGPAERQLPPPTALPFSLDELLQPPAPDQPCRLSDLLSPSDVQSFLVNAYSRLLGRAPDAIGSRGYSDYLERGGSRLRVLYALRFSAEGKLRGRAIDATPWLWLYRLLPWTRPLAPLLRHAERAYLRRHPEYLVPQLIGLLAPLLERRAAEVDQRLHASEQQIVDHRAEVDQRLHASEQQIQHLSSEQSHLRGDTRNLSDRALAIETELAKQRGGGEWLQRQIDNISASLQRLEDSLAEAQSAIGGEVARRERLSKDLDFIRSDLIYHRGQAQELLQALRAGQPSLIAASQQPLANGQYPHAPRLGAVTPAPVLPEDDRLDAYYVAFEEEFRGAQEQIRETQEGYIADLEAAAVVTPDAPVLDLGCGRGEWLALLAEHVLSARGIDTNAVMVQRCRSQGLDARCEDALTALRALPDSTLGAVSAFHLIEHLPFEVLHDLLAQAHRTLRPGGLLILETPNPENVLVGSHTFYHDPTHRNPMTPTATRFLVRYLGFTDPEIRRLHPYPESAKVPGNDPLTERVNGHLCWPQDFAIIAKKPELASKQAPKSSLEMADKTGLAAEPEQQAT